MSYILIIFKNIVVNSPLADGVRRCEFFVLGLVILSIELVEGVAVRLRKAGVGDRDGRRRSSAMLSRFVTTKARGAIQGGEVGRAYPASLLQQFTKRCDLLLFKDILIKT